MVNESNMPKEAIKYAQLEDRLNASNRALVEIQAEHNQLLQEMQHLRERVAEMQRTRVEQQVQQEHQQEQQVDINQRTDVETVSSSVQEESIHISENSKSSQSIEMANKVIDNILLETDDLEDINFIKEKMAQLPALKSQFNKIQNMMKSNAMIEEHLSHTSSSCFQESQNSSTMSKHTEERSTEERSIEETVEQSIEQILSNQSSSSSSKLGIEINAKSSVTSTDDKKELMENMVHKFQEISGELKEQINSLKAEKERTRTLKGKILNQKEGTN